MPGVGSIVLAAVILAATLGMLAIGIFLLATGRHAGVFTTALGAAALLVALLLI